MKEEANGWSKLPKRASVKIGNKWSSLSSVKGFVTATKCAGSCCPSDPKKDSINVWMKSATDKEAQQRTIDEIRRVLQEKNISAMFQVHQGSMDLNKIMLTGSGGYGQKMKNFKNSIKSMSKSCPTISAAELGFDEPSYSSEEYPHPSSLSSLSSSSTSSLLMPIAPPPSPSFSPLSPSSPLSLSPLSSPPLSPYSSYETLPLVSGSETNAIFLENLQSASFDELKQPSRNSGGPKAAPSLGSDLFPNANSKANGHPSNKVNANANSARSNANKAVATTKMEDHPQKEKEQTDTDGQPQKKKSWGERMEEESLDEPIRNHWAGVKNQNNWNSRNALNNSRADVPTGKISSRSNTLGTGTSLHVSTRQAARPRRRSLSADFSISSRSKVKTHKRSSFVELPRSSYTESDPSDHLKKNRRASSPMIVVRNEQGRRSPMKGQKNYPAERDGGFKERGFRERGQQRDRGEGRSNSFSDRGF
eukprot:TRINITY_DN5883_c0_g1_i1.p1 TRINITY_DN5883_c0_g1~~TRINITY_DN5883_c0_g1_i1.p1  ORF type:complete len:477 (+),score=75.86 TRINITY_DN5883_c0_g1_i1:1291-2721(+)